MTLNTGQILNNRYRIVKMLGQGGFGAVYRAWDLNLNAPCAVKENFETSPDAGRQFAREASMLANLHHPNLPRVTDHFSLPGQGQYLVMDYVEGQDVNEIMLASSELLPEAQVLNLARQVCDALEYLHTRTPPIVHRDIKPANIRVRSDGVVMLVDFGIAKFYDPTLRTTMGARAVTPGYSPFEQYGQKPTDARTDIYALGATLYALLTGQVPVESIERMSGTELPTIRQFNPLVSENTEQTILKALETLPNHRFQSAADFRTALLRGPIPSPSTESLLPVNQPTLYDRSKFGDQASPSRPPVVPPFQSPIIQSGHQPTQFSGPSPALAAIPVDRRSDPLLPTPKQFPLKWLILSGSLLLGIVVVAVGTFAIIKILPQFTSPGGVFSLGRVTATDGPSHSPRRTETPTSTPSEPREIIRTVIVTQDVLIVEVTPFVEEITPTPITTEEAPRTLVICMGQEPDSLYPYGTSMLAASQVQAAIWDGPIDNRTYSYQPIILEKLPSLADGDAAINPVSVAAGDLVVDADGNPGTLTSGMVVKPAGCRSMDCAITYSGSSPLQMDQMVVTFSLLPGLTYSDGTPLTAADSVYSFNLNADPDSPASKYLVERTTSYVATGSQTNIWTGMPGFIDSTYFVNYWTPYPQSLWGQYTAADLVSEVDNQGLWLGWGAYTVDEWVRGDSIRLSRNHNYFRASEGLPHFANLVYRFIGEDPNAAIAALAAGECDIIDQTFSLESQSELLLEMQAAGQLNATFVTGTTYEHADFNIQPVDSYRNSGGFAGWDQDYDGLGPFGDVRLRRAVAMCMDRQAVVDTVFYGQSITIDTYIPPEHPLYNPNNVSWPYDPVAAGALLDNIGWLDGDGNPSTPRIASGVQGVPNGTLLSFNYNSTSSAQRMAATQIMAESAIACGIQMNLSYYPASEWFASGPDGILFGRRFDLGQFAWLTGVQPACDLFITSQIPGDPAAVDANGAAIYPSGWGGQNETGFSDPAFDAACLAAIQSLPGEEAYTTNHLEAQRIFAEQLPVVPLYLRLKLAATRPDMCNFFMDPTANSEMWNIEEFNYGDDCR
jgi:peptide/nickel transport system substrate-binding protein